MSLIKLIRAGAMGLALCAITYPAFSQSGPVLRVVRGATASNIAVTVDRAIVVESQVPVSELSLANPAIADVAVLSETNLYVLGRAPGRTTLTMIGLNGELIANVEIGVTPDLTEFKERLADILPGEPIEVRSAGEGIVLSGRVSGARRVSRAVALAEQYAPGAVTNLLTVGGSQQVMLKVRFAEMQRSVSQQLGFGLGIGAQAGVLTGAGATSNILAGTLGGEAASTIPISGESFGAFAALFRSSDLALDLVIEALETEGLVRTLAEPNVVALSGEEASFLAGGEYPIPVQNDDGTTSIEFKPFGVQLDFTPTVIDEDLINLEIATEVSSLNANVTVTAAGIAISGFNTRNANTTVEMRDGQSFAIAGLLQDDFTDTVAQVPLLGDVPILGTLFRSTSFRRAQTELVIIITPYLVSPTDGELLSLPTDRVQIPNERELFLMGRTVGAGSEIAGQDFEGGYGYVLE
ncbi:type II and III secretion system protein family protein [Pontivivens insulae]|uniref:Type II secretion system protein D n=1 Tax=Pontivivens insulae TaxID=1639689 RepID=A0A2R8A8Q9_9RHOB|nr:type II and III secretion system protein family protein [Pontivivens insulae]RED18715.1 pilus assembly protein CpaC [Pontivivens insulae]SPF28613.1 Type II secretion system protein D [Pontivivens insulae]